MGRNSEHEAKIMGRGALLRGEDLLSGNGKPMKDCEQGEVLSDACGLWELGRCASRLRPP